jgi:hypothetical protein
VITRACSITYCNGACRGFNKIKKAGNTREACVEELEESMGGKFR